MPATVLGGKHPHAGEAFGPGSAEPDRPCHPKLAADGQDTEGQQHKRMNWRMGFRGSRQPCAQRARSPPGRGRLLKVFTACVADIPVHRGGQPPTNDAGAAQETLASLRLAGEQELIVAIQRQRVLTGNHERRRGVNRGDVVRCPGIKLTTDCLADERPEDLIPNERFEGGLAEQVRQARREIPIRLSVEIHDPSPDGELLLTRKVQQPVNLGSHSVKERPLRDRLRRRRRVKWNVGGWTTRWCDGCRLSAALVKVTHVSQHQ
jgi:hypothetical protein